MTLPEPIAITIPGPPVGKGRPRVFHQHGRLYVNTPEKSKRWEAGARRLAQMAMAGRKPLEGPVSLFLVARMPIPASWPRKKREAAERGDVAPTTRPDLDNIVKAVQDALNGIVYRDDALVVTITAIKRYGEPEVWVEVMALDKQAAATARSGAQQEAK